MQSNFRGSQQELATLVQQNAYDLLLIPRSSIPSDNRAALERALDNAGSQVLLVN